MTLFTSHCLLPPKTVSKILDSFLIEGWKVIYRVSLAVLSFYEEKLETFDMEQILMYKLFYLKIFTKTSKIKCRRFN